MEGYFRNFANVFLHQQAELYSTRFTCIPLRRALSTFHPSLFSVSLRERRNLTLTPKFLGFFSLSLIHTNAIMSQNGKLMPNLDQQSTKLLNLTVLQRIDPFVEEILITAAHVTFYEFNIDLSQWVRYFSLFLYVFSLYLICLSSFSFIDLQSRKDVEGSLFVVKRLIIFFLRN